MKPKSKYDIYPLTIVIDRYGGTYSGALFTAFNQFADNLPHQIHGSDLCCAEFWDNFKQGFIETGWFEHKLFCGFGRTPDEALEDLFKKITTTPDKV